MVSLVYLIIIIITIITFLSCYYFLLLQLQESIKWREMNPPSPYTAARWLSSPSRRGRWWRFTGKRRRRRGNVRNEEMRGNPVKALFILTPWSWDCRGEHLSLSLCVSLSLFLIMGTSTSLHIRVWPIEKKRGRKLDKTAIWSFCRRDFLLMFNFTGWKRAMICLIKKCCRPNEAEHEERD